jgi:hypothetical protein
MHPDAEEGPHLLRGYRVASLQVVNSEHARTDPHTWRLATLGVVRRQTDMTLGSGIEGCHLPRQIVVPRAGGQLVNAHRHSHQKDEMDTVGGQATQPKTGAMA